MKLRLNSESAQTGAIVVTILALMIFFTTMLLGLVGLAQANLDRARGRIMLLQAQYAAESGADSVIAELNNGNDTYAGTAGDVTLLGSGQYRATYDASMTGSGNERVITATGKVYDPASRSTPNYTRTIRVTAERSSTTTAASIVSRNIIAIDSGVKNITAKDIFVNGYITMAKNTTNLIAENVTVAGKDSGASNCSIGGTGNLLKPTSFSDPSQTKTKLTLAYNNCISPPGNTSNTDFDVLSNQTDISTVKSMYIPWDTYMDSSYLDAPAGCADWTSGTSPRTIPSSPKASHYPDSGNGVSTSCGNNGDIDLGSATYNITDNVHLRANLCATTACNPTFDNTSGSIKYVFVEGTINFGSVQTTPGSAPLVFVTYGTDPASKTSVCPYGGSIYLGNGGDTSAPALYFLATNGLCLDKTKFSSDPALGGIGGKNIWVATNPGTPFDLAMDPNFPASSIPIDLAWREVYYERIK